MIIAAILLTLHTIDSFARGYSYGHPDGYFVFFVFVVPIGVFLLISLYNNFYKTIFVVFVNALAVGGSWFAVAYFRNDLGLLAIIPALIVFYGAFKLWDVVYPDDNKNQKE
jgi:hypothetical protein